MTHWIISQYAIVLEQPLDSDLYKKPFERNFKKFPRKPILKKCMFVYPLRIKRIFRLGIENFEDDRYFVKKGLYMFKPEIKLLKCLPPPAIYQ